MNESHSRQQMNFEAAKGETQMGLNKKTNGKSRPEDNSSVNSLDLNDRRSPSTRHPNDSPEFSNKTPHNPTPMQQRLVGPIVKDSGEY